MSPLYPKTNVTLGDHLRKVRLDRNLSQPQVAKIIGVTTDTITLWENNQCLPRIGHTQKIFAFLGYNPLDTAKPMTLDHAIFNYRQQKGLTKKKLAKKIGIDEATLTRLEEGKFTFDKTKRKVEAFFL